MQREKETERRRLSERETGDFSPVGQNIGPAGP